MPCESEKSNNVVISGSFLSFSYRKDSSIGTESIIFPGLNIPNGSKTSFIRFKIS